KLDEDNVVLLARIVKTIGVTKAKTLLQMTDTIEDTGGMLTNDGTRRRTRGGVFIQLVKNEKSLSKTQLRQLFEPNFQLRKRVKKRRTMMRRANAGLEKIEKILG